MENVRVQKYRQSVSANKEKVTKRAIARHSVSAVSLPNLLIQGKPDGESRDKKNRICHFLYNEHSSVESRRR